jgi:dynein heavy chain, axonemal
VVESFVDVQSVIVKSNEFKPAMGRINYVTPTGYLELISTFSKLLGKKRQELNLRTRTTAGLKNLLNTAEEVAELKAELTQMQPMLVEAQQETQATMIKIPDDKAIAQETVTQVAKEEKEAGVKAAEPKEIAEDAQRRSGRGPAGTGHGCGRRQSQVAEQERHH